MVRIGSGSPCPNLYAKCPDLRKACHAMFSCIERICNSVFLSNPEVMYLAPDASLGQPQLQGIAVHKHYGGEIFVYLQHDVFEMGIGEVPYAMGDDTATDAFLRKKCVWIK
ncbi:MAG TPA: hypothetical protein VLE89_04515 [Chlamydiales bacterium]|nr:hypothetical protein [Chlamydiales bacterium]